MSNITARDARGQPQSEADLPGSFSLLSVAGLPFVDGPVCQGSAPALAWAQLQKPRELQGQREEAPGLEREVSWVMASGILTFLVP